MKTYPIFLFILTVAFGTFTCHLIRASAKHQESFALAAILQPVDLELSIAKVYTSGNQLVVSSGVIKRTWNWTGIGLQTVGIEDLKSGREWCTMGARYMCDWSLPGLINETTQAELVSLTAKISDDEHFTSEHIEVVAEIHYETHVALQYLKESHKCVNQPGLSTGAFHAEGAGFSSTGWGIQVKEIIADQWRYCWAHWLIIYIGFANFKIEKPADFLFLKYDVK